MEAWDSHAILICDEGKNAEVTRLIRKMRVYNPVPVYVGPGTLQTQNLATHRIVEDPVFIARFDRVGGRVARILHQLERDRYDDEVSNEQGTWRFAERRLYVDWTETRTSHP